MQGTDPWETGNKVNLIIAPAYCLKRIFKPSVGWETQAESGRLSENLRRQSWESGKPKTARGHRAEERAIWKLGRYPKICRGSPLSLQRGTNPCIQSEAKETTTQKIEGK